MNGYTQRSAGRTGHENGQEFENSKPTVSGFFMKQSHTESDQNRGWKGRGKRSKVKPGNVKSAKGYLMSEENFKNAVLFYLEASLEGNND